MSGRKYTTVTISTEERNRLLERERELSKIRKDLPQIIRDAVRTAEQNAEARIRPIQERQAAYQRALQEASNTIRRVEIDAANRIANQAQKAKEENERIKRELQRELDHVRKEQIKQDQQIQARIHILDKKIEDEAKTLKTEINKEREARRKADAEIRQEIDDIKEDRQRSRVLAQERIHDCNVIAGFIRGHYQHERFAPGALERIETSIASAQNVLNGKSYEAALAISTTSVNDLSELRIRLEELEAEWSRLRTQASILAEAMLEAINEKRVIHQVEGSEEIRQADYWVQGKLKSFEEKISGILETVKDENTSLTSQNLHEIIDSMPDKQDHLEAILQAAYESVMRSQHRAEIAACAAQELITNNGFKKVGATYDGKDMRGEVVAIVDNILGDKVVITVGTTEDGECITIDSIESSPRSPEEHRKQMDAIRDSIIEAGYEVDIPREVSQKPSNKNADLEEVERRQPTLPNPVIRPTPRPVANQPGTR